MVLLSIVVPAYNAQDYLHRSLEPLMHLRHDVEVIVVDDGSTDRTGTIADAYAAHRPDLVRVIHQRNAGHGGAINAGIAAATGTYLKVLDADDWLSVSALEQVLRELHALERDGGVDALFTDYVHDRVGKANKPARFDSVFPADGVFGWERTERFGRRQVLMMHAIIFRTDVVRDSGLVLPEHTFYVDNLFVVVPLVRVRRMRYLPVSLYHYFIGRADQSVNADVMIRRVDQQVRVNKLLLRSLPTPEQVITEGIPEQLHGALVRYIEQVCAVTSATLARAGTEEHLALRDEFWREIREESPWIYTRLRRGFMGASSNLPGHAGRKVTSLAYQVARRVVGFS